MKKTIILFCAALVLLFSCQTTKDPGDFDSAPLIGMVYSAGNNACSNADVLIIETTDGNSKEHKTVTDVYGKFSFSDIKKGGHTITVTKDGFEKNEFTFTFNRRTQAMYVYLLSESDLLESMEEAISRKENNEAIEYGERILALNEKNTKALFLGAGAYISLAQADSALKYISRLEKIIPGDAWVTVLKADILQYINKTPDEAFSLLESIPSSERDEYINKRIRDLMIELGIITEINRS